MEKVLIECPQCLGNGIDEKENSCSLCEGKGMIDRSDWWNICDQAMEKDRIKAEAWADEYWS